MIIFRNWDLSHMSKRSIGVELFLARRRGRGIWGPNPYRLTRQGPHPVSHADDRKM
jgi:hypothetical protein